MSGRKLVFGLSILLLSMGVAEARGLFYLLNTPRYRETSEYRPSSIGQDEALALYTAKQQKTSFIACTDQFPLSRPIDLASVSATMKPLALCSDYFAVLYSQTSKTPLVVVERLSSARLQDAKGLPRTNLFYPDPRIPKSGRAELSDYRAAAHPVQRGHQSPAADSPTPNAMSQSFALSNMVPQDPASNQGAWNRVESDVRKFVQRAGGNVFVFTGPIFDAEHTTIGENNVWVPTRLFKLVYDENSKRAWAYILPNAESRIEKPVDYATFVKATGLHLLDDVTLAGSVREKRS